MAIMHHRHNHPIMITASRYMLKSLDVVGSTKDPNESAEKQLHRKRRFRNILSMCHIAAKFDGIQDKRFVGMTKDQRDEVKKIVEDKNKSQKERDECNAKLFQDDEHKKKMLNVTDILESDQYNGRNTDSSVVVVNPGGSVQKNAP